jgi:hypothetical protein
MLRLSTLVPRTGLWLLLLLVLSVEAAVAWMVPHHTLSAFPCCHGLAKHASSCRVVPGNNNRMYGEWRLYNTGGWGIGPQRELTPEEFAKRGSGSGSVRRPTTGYELRDRGEFMRQVSRDKASLQSDALEELLEVAAAAGIKVKDPKERLNKFSPEETSNEDEDELDLSVPLDDTAIDAPTKSKTAKDTDSITRLDEDTGALGVW